MNSIIKVENLCKDYGDFSAVKNINFDIKKGEIFGFLGPNGAGKTSTINMLIGMAKITSGKLYYKNEDLTNSVKKVQQMIGIVPDESNLYDEMTGFENLCFCGSLYGLKKQLREDKAKELLEIFKLTEAGNKKFKAYSKGMKRKLTIAAALIHEPEVLFLDEPTTGIDVASVRQIRNLIKVLNEKGTTVFLTTHYIEEAERLCNRVAFINKGEIIKLDTVEKLLDDTKELNTVEVVFEETKTDIASILNNLQANFAHITCSKKNETCIKVISEDKLDISPIVNFLANEKLFILEARLLRPSLEEAFVKLTGIEIEQMKKEKK